MKTTKTLYWVFTALFAFIMAGSAIPDILSMPEAVGGIHNALGYPLYFIPFIGVAKALGAVAIIVPGSKRIKEWAYAGLFYDLLAATYSLICVPQHHAGGAWYFMLIPISIGVLSYFFYRKKQQSATL